MKKTKLSVVLATRNEEANIEACLASVKSIVDEIVVVDENSTDKTRQIAERLGARVYNVEHETIFHKTKQKALDLAMGDWILQLDADERIPRSLASEIQQVIAKSDEELIKYRSQVLDRNLLFQRHERIIEDRDGQIGKKTGEIVAFFIPRVNMFLGKPLTHAGVYPDPAIRLIKKDKAWFPAKSVHEIMQIEGEVAWLENPMGHHDSPTLNRYLLRLNRYTDLKARELKENKTPRNVLFLLYYAFFVPLGVFFKLFLRHKGFKDGVRGFLWSFFSASHFPVAYFKYYTNEKDSN